MLSDREALIAGIAADPGNDLRRLVFADWLEEYGEPERAEFIRLQIEAETDLARRDTFHARAGTLFTEFGAKWFAPFLSALDPTREATAYSFRQMAGSRTLVVSVPTPGAPHPFVSGLDVRRGFAASVVLRLAAHPAGGSIDAALRHEPLDRLFVSLGPDPRQWTRFSEPGLRLVPWLVLQEESANGQLTGSRATFNDPHLAGVRTLALVPVGGAAESQPVLAVSTVQEFARSPLGYRVTDLSLALDDAGLRALSRSASLRPDRLSVNGPITATGLRPLTVAPFAPALRSLRLLSPVLTDADLSALANAEHFHKLVELDLSGTPVTDTGLQMLAAARFLPQLEVLDLSGSLRMVFELRTGLHALADALNPDGLRRLRLANCGYDVPPAFLTAKFGDRVSVT